MKPEQRQQLANEIFAQMAIEPTPTQTKVVNDHLEYGHNFQIHPYVQTHNILDGLKKSFSPHGEAIIKILDKPPYLKK